MQAGAWEAGEAGRQAGRRVLPLAQPYALACNCKASPGGHAPAQSHTAQVAFMRCSNGSHIDVERHAALLTEGEQRRRSHRVHQGGCRREG